MRRAILFVALGLASCAEERRSVICTSSTDCAAPASCNLLTGVCQAPSPIPAGQDGIAGTFDCTVTSTGAGGEAQLVARFGGADTALTGGCAVILNDPPESSEIVFFGRQSGAVVRAFELVHEKEQVMQAGMLSIPNDVFGVYFTPNAEVAPSSSAFVTRAFAWMGMLEVVEVTPSRVRGRLQANLVAAETTGTFGSQCQTARACTDRSPCAWPELATPTCGADVFCQPFRDGTRNGFCSRACQLDYECKAYDPQSACVRVGLGTVCVHTCTGATCPAGATCSGAGTAEGHEVTFCAATAWTAATMDAGRRD